jgi:hypothetical protein
MKQYDATEQAYKNGYKQGVKDFAEMAKESFANLEYRANTHRKTVKVEELREQIDWVLHVVVPQTIDQVAKEMGVEL